jgi:hypothetical protein
VIAKLGVPPEDVSTSRPSPATLPTTSPGSREWVPKPPSICCRPTATWRGYSPTSANRKGPAHQAGNRPGQCLPFTDAGRILLDVPWSCRRALTSARSNRKRWRTAWKNSNCSACANRWTASLCCFPPTQTTSPAAKRLPALSAPAAPSPSQAAGDRSPEDGEASHTGLGPRAQCRAQRRSHSRSHPQTGSCPGAKPPGPGNPAAAAVAAGPMRWLPWPWTRRPPP